VSKRNLEGLHVIPITLRDANAFVLQYHRHHKPVRGCCFCIGAAVGNILVGAAIIGRPVARLTDYTRVAEVTRLVTDGTPNACSILYGAAARAASAIGYRRIQTFLLAEELGTSVKAAGWKFDGMTPGGTWNCKVRTGRREDQPLGPKQRWVKEL